MEFEDFEDIKADIVSAISNNNHQRLTELLSLVNKQATFSYISLNDVDDLLWGVCKAKPSFEQLVDLFECLIAKYATSEDISKLIIAFFRNKPDRLNAQKFIDFIEVITKKLHVIFQSSHLQQSENKGILIQYESLQAVFQNSLNKMLNVYLKNKGLYLSYDLLVGVAAYVVLQGYAFHIVKEFSELHTLFFVAMFELDRRSDFTRLCQQDVHTRMKLNHGLWKYIQMLAHATYFESRWYVMVEDWILHFLTSSYPTEFHSIDYKPDVDAQVCHHLIERCSELQENAMLHYPICGPLLWPFLLVLCTGETDLENALNKDASLVRYCTEFAIRLKMFHRVRVCLNLLPEYCKLYQPCHKRFPLLDFYYGILVSRDYFEDLKKSFQDYTWEILTTTDSTFVRVISVSHPRTARLVHEVTTVEEIVQISMARQTLLFSSCYPMMIVACFHHLCHALRVGDEYLTQWLLERVDLHAFVDSEGNKAVCTLLHAALSSQGKALTMTRLIIRYGIASLVSCGCRGTAAMCDSAIIDMIKQGNLEILQLLYEAGICTNYCMYKIKTNLQQYGAIRDDIRDWVNTTLSFP